MTIRANGLLSPPEKTFSKHLNTASPVSIQVYKANISTKSHSVDTARHNSKEKEKRTERRRIANHDKPSRRKYTSRSKETNINYLRKKKQNEKIGYSNFSSGRIGVKTKIRPPEKQSWNEPIGAKKL